MKGALSRADRRRLAARAKTGDMRAEYVAKTGVTEAVAEPVKRGRTNGVYTLRPTKRGDER